HRGTPPHITYREIWQQVKRDINSKEVQTSPTYSYQWMADQAGHIAIGMLFVLLAWSLGELLHLQLNRDFGVWPSLVGFITLFAWASYKEHNDYSQACAKIESFSMTRVISGIFARTLL